MAEQIVLALGDACGPPRRNPFAIAVGQLGRRLIDAVPQAIVLDNADLDEGADAIERDIERLNDVVLRYNTGAGCAGG